MPRKRSPQAQFPKLGTGADSKLPKFTGRVQHESEGIHRLAEAKPSQTDRLQSVLMSQISESLSRKANNPDIVAEGLRNAIILGHYKSGDRIKESRIAIELGLSQSSVREALAELEHEGLIVRYPNRGCRVTTLSKTNMNQIFQVRITLEPLAAQLAKESWAPWKAEKLTKAFQDLKSAAATRDGHKFYGSDLQFHMTLWSLSENRYLEKSLRGLVLPLFVSIQEGARKSASFDVSLTEHEQILNAMLRSRTPKEAGEMIKAILMKFWREGQRIAARHPHTAET